MTISKTPLILAATWAALSGCTDRQPCDGGQCGTAIIVVGADATTMFPPAALFTTDAAVMDQIFLKLADLGIEMNTVGDQGFIPRLARAWRFEDSTTLVFELDSRAVWQDGTPVTAHDVAFTYSVYNDPLVGSSTRPLLHPIAAVEARDDRTAVFRFRRPYLEMVYDATHHMRILPRHLMDSIPRARLSSHPIANAPVGNGPYRLARWRRNESIELEADTAFFQGRPGLARVIWQVTPDASGLLTRLLAGESDAIDHLMTPEGIERGRAAPHLQLIEYPSPTYVFLQFNLRAPGNPGAAHPLFADREVRRAIFQAIDRRTLVDVVLGARGAIPVGPVSRIPTVGRDTVTSWLPYDTAAARATLAAAGWRDTDGDGVLERRGRRLQFNLLFPTSSAMRNRTATLIQAQLKQVGIDARPLALEPSTMGQGVSRSQFDAVLMNWNDDPSPASIAQTFTTEGIGGSNYGRYSNPEFDRLVMEATFATDSASRVARWREVYRVINQDAPGVWLYTLTQVGAVHRRFENVAIRPDQWTALLWTWRVKPGEELPRDVIGRTAATATAP